MNIKSILIGCLLVVSMLTIGCGKKEEASDAKAKAGSGEAKWTIGMSQCTEDEPWRVQMDADIKKAAEEHPEINLILKVAQDDSLKQKSQVEEFISAFCFLDNYKNN